MDKKTIAFLSLIISVGILILGFSLYKISGQSNVYDMIYWMLLAGLCQSFLVVFNKNRYVSVVFAIIFAVQLTYGTYYSVIIAAGSQTFFVYKEKPQTYRHIFSVPPYKTLFNVANVSISAFTSGTALEFLSKVYELDITKLAFTLLMLIYTLSYALLNTGILMALMSLLNRDSFFKLWGSLMSWILPNFAAIAPFGYFVALLYNQALGKIYIALLVGPLLLARHSFQLYQNSKEQYYKTVKALTAAIEAKDPYTEGHSRRVEGYASQIAHELRLDNATIHSIEVAALLHDIGKIGINDSILNKKEVLNSSEFSQIHHHPIIGVKILEDIELPLKSKDIIRYHHERYDGKGYPKGIGGDQVPIEAYILSAADAYDAMTSNRPYRDAMSPTKAVGILIEGSGTQFHPDVVEAFVKVLKR
ncbi:MAG TPA: HD-GYP domain-containing protein [Clostridia bacterium]|nr:HD-GYP domain-containing protein [Clostridia bacterium]